MIMQFRIIFQPESQNLEHALSEACVHNLLAHRRSESTDLSYVSDRTCTILNWPVRKTFKEILDMSDGMKGSVDGIESPCSTGLSQLAGKDAGKDAATRNDVDVRVRYIHAEY